MASPRLAPALADSAWTAPRRPRLPADADTNSADAYENWGKLRLRRAPDSAAAAFYWTSRLDPWRASAYYERAIALVLTHAEPPERGSLTLPRLITRQLSAAEVALVDSLNSLAMMRDPFLQRSLDRMLSGAPPWTAVSRIRDPVSRGYWRFTLGAWDSAVVDLGKALAKKPELSAMRIMRAVSFFHLGRYDSTATELETVLARGRVRDATERVILYRSKAAIHYSLGIALVQLGDARARAHFEQALEEDLSFYMARVRLAGIDLAGADTTAAIASLAQAVDIKSDDPALQYYYGLLLRNHDNAAARLAFERSVGLAPEYAAPHFQLALLAEARGDTATAIAAYDRFVALSSRDEPVRGGALARRRLLASQLVPR